MAGNAGRERPAARALAFCGAFGTYEVLKAPRTSDVARCRSLLGAHRARANPSTLIALAPQRRTQSADDQRAKAAYVTTSSTAGFSSNTRSPTLNAARIASAACAAESSSRA